MKKRLSALLLAVCVLLTFVPTAAFAAGENVIANVALSGFTEPVYGATSDFDLSVPSGAHYHLASREELEAFKDQYAPGALDHYFNGCSIQMPTAVHMKPGDTYTEEGRYLFNIALIPDPGYKFAEQTSATLNGEPVFSGFCRTENGGKRFTATYQSKYVELPKATITFRVENGTWMNGTTKELSFDLPLTDVHKGTLKPETVPTGMKPFPGFTEGAWDVEPNTEANGISGDVTYTYTFKEDANKAVVTFKVVRGSWSDKTYADRAVEVQLTDGSGALTADQIPTGMVPAAHYGDGAWDATPTTDAGSITGDTAYTYTFVLVDANGDNINDRDQKTVITYTSGLPKGNGEEESGFVTGLPGSETVTWKRLADGRYSIPVSAKVPVRDSFKFDGWARETGYDSAYDAKSNAVIINSRPPEKMTLLARWKSPTGKLAEIVYHAGSGGSRPNGDFYEEIPASYAYTPRTPQELGITLDNSSYSFFGWSESLDQDVIGRIYGSNDPLPALVTTVNAAEGTRKELTALYGFDGNKNGIADLTEKKLTISFDMNAGVLAGAEQIKPIQAVAGAAVMLPVGVQSNRTDVCWVGWSPVRITKILTSDDPRPELADHPTVTEDTTFYAVWGQDTNQDTVADVLQTATVTYEAPGAQNVPAPHRVLVKDEESGAGEVDRYPIDPGIPAMEGKVFGGWQWKEDAAFTSEPGADYIDLTNSGCSDITLVAIWHDPVKSTYTLSFDGNGSTGGKVPAALTQQGYDDAAEFEVPDAGDLVREKYFFICWNTKADDTGDYFWPGDKIQVPKDTELKLYASWAVSPVMHFEIPEADAGTVPDDVYAQPDGQGMLYFTLPAAAPSRAGYEFLGYRVKPVFDDVKQCALTARPEHLDETKLYQPGAKIYCDDALDCKVTAKWKKLPKPVVPPEQPTPAPSAVPKPAAPAPSAAPQTGESSNMMLWSMITVLALGSAAGMLVLRKRRKN